MKHLLILLFCLCSRITVVGQFGPEYIFTGNQDLLVDPTLMDFNGDGKLDMISATGGNFSDLQWNENFGNLKFSTDQLLPDQGEGVSSLRTGDMDGDGDLDIVISVNNENAIYWYENMDGEMTNKITVSSIATDVTDIRIMDVNNDGQLDIFAILGFQVVWFQNSGGSFGLKIIIPNISYNNFDASIVADLDNDGDDDIVYTYAGTDAVMWHENLGGGTFANSVTITNMADHVQHISAVDLDNDLDLDLVAALGSPDQIIWMENLGGAMFGPVQLVGSINYPRYTCTADLDGDGDQDILAAGFDEVVWYENQGAPLFAPAQVISGDISQARFVGAGDIDGDGDMDVYSCEPAERKLAWYQNDGNANFGNQMCIQSQHQNTKFLVNVDFDLDGDIDIVSDSGPLGKKIWYENYAPGKWVSERVITVGNFTAFPNAVTDIDGDGDYDYAITSNTDSIGWFENMGNMVFGTYQSITTQVNNVTTILFEDIDMDGDLDLVSASYDDDKIAWCQNLGGGNFGPQIVISTLANGPQRIVCRDLDNDGDLDIVSTSKLDDKVAIYQNLGGGTFAPQQIVSGAMDEVGALGLGDIDNDGDLDIIACAIPGGKISWFENLSALTFGAEQIISTQIAPIKDIVVCDLDDDGDLDLLYAMDLPSPSDLLWSENFGGGVFGPETTFGNVFASNQKVSAADFDNDGDLDVNTIVYQNKIASYENFKYSQKQIAGRMFADINQNLVHDSTDFGLGYIGAISSPSSDFSFTYSSGNYMMNFSDVAGIYEIFPQIFPYWSIVTDSTSYHINVDTAFSSIDSLDFGFYPDTIINEINPEIIGGFPRCNTLVNYWVSYQNTGTTIPSGFISLQLDSSLTFVSCAFVPDSIVENTLYWSYDSLFYFSSQTFPLLVEMPDFTSLGSEMVSILTVFVTDLTDSVIYSNTAILDQTLVCSYDPNDKISEPAGLDSMGYIDPLTENIEYTIRFQNTGNDTALTVIIKDQLDPYLDWQTLTPLASSHPMIVNGNQDGKVTFTFNSIMLPDSNVNEPASHGFVKFRISLLPGVSPGTSIYNFAEIYFDINPPVITNTKILTLYDCDAIMPSMPLLSHVNLCLGDTLFGVLPGASNNANYSWILLDFGDTLTGNNMQWDADTSGNFEIVFVAANDFCHLETDLQIIVFPDIPLTNQGVVSICEGDSIMIFSNYQTAPGLYYDSLQSIYGCDSVLSIQLNLLTLPVVQFDVLPDDKLCIDASSISISGSPTGGSFSGSGVSGNQFNPAMAGLGTHQLYYSYTAGDGCTNTDSAQVQIVNCLTTMENNLYTISVYPNPVLDFTVINFGRTLSESACISIYDLCGKIVYSCEAIYGDKIEIDLNYLEAGSYILFIMIEGSSEVHTVKLIIE